MILKFTFFKYISNIILACSYIAIFTKHISSLNIYLFRWTKYRSDSVVPVAGLVVLQVYCAASHWFHQGIAVQAMFVVVIAHNPIPSMGEAELVTGFYLQGQVAHLEGKIIY